MKSVFIYSLYTEESLGNLDLLYVHKSWPRCESCFNFKSTVYWNNHIALPELFLKQTSSNLLKRINMHAQRSFWAEIQTASLCCSLCIVHLKVCLYDPAYPRIKWSVKCFEVLKYVMIVYDLGKCLTSDCLVFCAAEISKNKMLLTNNFCKIYHSYWSIRKVS